MSKNKEKQKAIYLRNKGYSYSQIKKEIKVSKSTLNNWLSDMPLSISRMKELRDNNEDRIENFRKTMRKKREDRFLIVYKKVKKDIGKLSKRDLFIAGLFLYWGEGTKTKDYYVEFTNTNPNMIKIFIKWLNLFKINKSKLKCKLHLYSDMNIDETIDFWAKELKIDKRQFNKPYIKKNSSKLINYKNSVGKGTCCVILSHRDLREYILASIKYLSEEK